MSREWAYDAEAMREMLCGKTDFELGDLDVADFSNVGETDATTLAERFREAFNSERELQRVNRIAGYVHPEYPEIIAREARQLRLASGQAHGLREAEAEGFSHELTERRVVTMNDFRMHQADRTQSIIDPRKSEDGSVLPAWSFDNPNSANVMRGVVATHPDRLYVLRGGFGPQELAQHVYDGDIETRCNIGASALCDPRCASDRPFGIRPIFAMFALTSGPHVILFSICQSCYWEFFHSDRNQISYDVFTPDIDDADDWQQRHGS